MQIKNNQLYLGKFSAKYLAQQKFGTPLYVYEADAIRKRYQELVKNIPYPKLAIHYACKANTNILILKLFHRLGAKIETVSKGEILLALKAGFKPKDILYTSTSIRRKEMQFVVKKKISINLDSLAQVEMYGKLNPNAKVGLRINQGIGAGHHGHVITGGPLSKFGIPLAHIPQAKKLAKKYGLTIVRIHQHIGSNILDRKIMLKAFDKLFETALEFSDLEALDFGGGFGIPYKVGEKNLDMKGLGRDMAKHMRDFCTHYGRELTMIFEPGRFLVAESGTLLAQVTEIKKNPGRTFVGIDTGFSQLIRPALYGSYHEIINASRIKGSKVRVDVSGNICESTDIFCRDRIVTTPKVGDIFAILTAGAYGYVMASEFNQRPLPHEILVDGKKVLSK